LVVACAVASICVLALRWRCLLILDTILPPLRSIICPTLRFDSTRVPCSCSPVQTQQVIHIPPRINPNPLCQPPGPPPGGLPAHPLRLCTPTHTHPVPHAARNPTPRALDLQRLAVARTPNQKRFTQFIRVERHAPRLCAIAIAIAIRIRRRGRGARGVGRRTRGRARSALGRRETHPDDPPAAAGLARSLNLVEGAPCRSHCGQDLRVDV
jgi:hypothetical protein